MFSALIKCTFCVVGPSPRLHTSSCTGLLADQGSGWHWGQALGEPASLPGWNELQKVPLFSFPSSPLHSCLPILLRVITKKRHEGFAETSWFLG